MPLAPRAGARAGKATLSRAQPLRRSYSTGQHGAVFGGRAGSGLFASSPAWRGMLQRPRGETNQRNVMASATQAKQSTDMVVLKDEDTYTLVQVKSRSGGGDMLMVLSGVFGMFDVSVIEASISSGPDGELFDVFHVATPDSKPIPEEVRDDLKEQITRVVSSTSRSRMPTIYGMAAAAEVQRLQPMIEDIDVMREGSTRQLELAAAEMAQAAAQLVQFENTLITESLDSIDGFTAGDPATEAKRQEAAAVLERKMAAMEAVLAARRKPSAPPVEEDAPPEPEVTPEAQAMQQLKMPVHTSTGPAAGNGNELVLQGFNWESCKTDHYQTLIQQAPEIAAAGYTAIWLPPPSDAVSPQGYLPRDLYDLNSKYGSESELRECIKELKGHNLKVIADIVINHRCAHKQDSAGRWNQFGGRLAWDESAVCCNNEEYGGRGAHKTGEDYTAAPNVDHTNESIQNDLVEWLNFLKDVGFDGWRFDFTKGYHGKYSKLYVDATVPQMAFGEFWDTCEYTDSVLNYDQDPHRQRTVDWIDATGGTCAAFDFTTKGILQEAVYRNEYWRLVDARGRPPGLIGLWPSRAITFIENHDTGSTLNHWPFPCDEVCQGYAYILTHPGTPCVFYDHHWSDANEVGEHIKGLLAMRKRCGINARSKVTVRKATGDCYAATIDDKLAVKIGHGQYSPNQDASIDCGVERWHCEESGVNFAAWVADGLEGKE